MRVYTFTLPKFVSGFVRKCIYVFQKEDKTKTNAKSTASKPKTKKKEKTPS
ncbi:stage V sporulation protein SpoVM [Sporosarcina siberiensis]|uniref:Stage V sporulation protein SpoVM n=1 Tax=Sporosarcina siberiensis TaxID=1365606 RepID=A0ABW4SID2_9BACL